jgi:hypothetical protein
LSRNYCKTQRDSEEKGEAHPLQLVELDLGSVSNVLFAECIHERLSSVGGHMKAFQSGLDQTLIWTISSTEMFCLQFCIWAGHLRSASEFRGRQG